MKALIAKSGRDRFMVQPTVDPLVFGDKPSQTPELTRRYGCGPTLWLQSSSQLKKNADKLLIDDKISMNELLLWTIWLCTRFTSLLTRSGSGYSGYSSRPSTGLLPLKLHNQWICNCAGVLPLNVTQPLPSWAKRHSTSISKEYACQWHDHQLSCSQLVTKTWLKFWMTLTHNKGDHLQATPNRKDSAITSGCRFSREADFRPMKKLKTWFETTAIQRL